jgi:hypothetical protein
VIHCGTLWHELSETEGVRATLFSSAAVRFEVPVANLRQLPQELQIGGTSPL